MHSYAVSDPGDRCFCGFVCQVSVARGGLDLRVAEEFADYRETLTECRSPRSKAVAMVVSSAIQRSGIRERQVPG